MVEDDRFPDEETKDERNDDETKDDEDEDGEGLAFGFGVGGWLQFYQFGVARAFQQMGKHKNAKIIGSSSGGLKEERKKDDWLIFQI